MTAHPQRRAMVSALPQGVDGSSRLTPPNRVPSVTIDFWLIKLMAVTMGETAADYLAVNFGLGLSVTSLIMSAILVITLAVQFARKRYVPWAYWLIVVIISIVGTLVSDNLVDNLGVTLEATTAIFGLALTVVFAAWFTCEGTLSIHTIVTTRREVFYWLAILLTFAFGTAAGDLVSETVDLGYIVTGILFAAVIGGIAFAYYGLEMSGTLAFWLAYISTRPLGIGRGPAVAADRVWRAGFRHVGHLAGISRLHRRDRRVHDADPERRTRGGGRRLLTPAIAATAAAPRPSIRGGCR
ncbi:MAG: COG4705 family protein [Inquilinus sp.]|uniref:COG4705 family protein n=1 Tax=Inquilinus sp. TaxID=1932117 RepID=UPI003F3FEF80